MPPPHIKIKKVKEFSFEDLPMSFTMILVAPPGSGKTEFIVNLCYYLKHRYPVARVFCGTETGYERMCKIFPPLYVSNYYDPEEEKKHIHRQRWCAINNGKEYAGNPAINILDDVTNDPRVLKGKEVSALFKLGSQHYNQACLVGMQYSKDPGSDIRNAVSYVCIGRQPDIDERDKLYKQYAGIVGDKDTFNDLMDQLTGAFTFLIIKKRSQSNELEDCVFYYTTEDMTQKKWKFGCKEYRKWAKKRYDQNYQEAIYDI